MHLIDNHYEISGINPLQLCEEFDTPLYVYDTAMMRRQYERLKNAFAGVPVEIKYACKALTNLNVLRFFRSIGTGLDATSIQEVQLGLLSGFLPSQILFTPNSVSIEEMKIAVGLGVSINIDSISILEQFGNLYGSSTPVSVRVNPHIIAGGHHNISVGHIDSKFGISVHQMRHVHRIVQSYNMKINGLHMHTGSDILDAEVFLQGAEILFEAAKNFPDLEFLDFGSGFKVGYKEGDITTDIEALGKKFTSRFSEFVTEYGKPLRVLFEPGKFLVSESGYFFVKANAVKQTTATVFVGVNSGFNHLIRPMFYDAYHHILNVSYPAGTPRIYTVVGNLCETDTFAWDRQLNEVREGDILCFLNAGAYGFTMASNYNARLRPAEVLIHEGKAYCIRKRETIEDLTRNQIALDIF